MGHLGVTDFHDFKYAISTGAAAKALKTANTGNRTVVRLAEFYWLVTE